jgi:predicted MFS family arabinose efflux permease
MIPRDRRGAAYGLFNTGFGLAWFVGSAVTGVLYDTSLSALVCFSVLLQLYALPLLWLVSRRVGGLSRVTR